MHPRRNLSVAAALALLGLLQAPQSAAREIHYGAIDHPRLNACDALAWRGREDESGRCYRELVSATGDPVIGAEAFWALGDIKSANTLFQEAVKARPDDPVARLRWGGLAAPKRRPPRRSERRRPGPRWSKRAAWVRARARGPSSERARRAAREIAARPLRCAPDPAKSPGSPLQAV